MNLAVVIFSLVGLVLGVTANKTQSFVESGKCPDYSTMETYDMLKEPKTSTTYSVYQTDLGADHQCKCGTAIQTQIDDSTTFIQFTGESIKKPGKIIAINSTATAIPGKLGVFDIKADENSEIHEDLGQLAELKYYILDTDYENYYIGICCFGDGNSTHTSTAVVDYKNINPPADLIEKANELFERAGIDITKIKPVDHTNCKNQS